MIFTIRLTAGGFYNYYEFMGNNLLPNEYSDESQLSSEESRPLSFIEKILSLFVNNSPEARKRKLLKDIRKILKKQKYKFLNVKTEEAQPQLARFYYQIYKTAAIAASFLLGQENSPALKYLFIDTQLSEKQKELVNRLHKDNVERRIRENPEEIKLVKAELKALLKSIRDEQKQNVQILYRQYLAFLQFIKFDYYFLLRKFDSNLCDMDFKYKPSFSPINCEYITEDIIDTISMFPVILKYSEWETLFSVLGLFKNQEIISPKEWTKILNTVAAVEKSRTLLYIVKLVNKDPFFKAEPSEPEGEIFEEYFNKLKTSVELVIQKIIKETKNNQRDTLLNEIFGTTVISRMKYYTENNNTTFKTKLLGGYLHIDFMNYLKAFMLDIVKNDILKLVNFFIVKAEWKSNNYSKSLSDSMDALVSLSEKVTNFDQSLASDEELGIKLNTYMKRMAADPKYKLQVKKCLIDVNNRAVVLGQDTYRNLVKIANGLKELIPDLEEKTKMSIIINPSAVKNAYTGGNIIDDIKKVYRRIYHFLQLTKLMIGK